MPVIEAQCASILEQLSRPVDEDRLGGFLSGVSARSFDEFAVDEGRPGADQGDEVGCVDGAPAILRSFDQLERHGQPGRPRAGALGDLGAVADRSEGGLNRVGGPQVHPVLARVVEERQQLAGVVGDLRRCLGELGPVGALEGLDRGQGMILILSAPDFGEGLLRPGVGGLGQRGQDVGGLMEPAAALPGPGEDLAQPVPEAQRPIADGQHRGTHPAAGAVAQQVRPRFRGLAVAVGPGR
jgi:hypothetical protein